MQAGLQSPCGTTANTYVMSIACALCKVHAAASEALLLLQQQEEERVDEPMYVDDYDEPLPKWSNHQARTPLPML